MLPVPVRLGGSASAGVAGASGASGASGTAGAALLLAVCQCGVWAVQLAQLIFPSPGASRLWWEFVFLMVLSTSEG